MASIAASPALKPAVPVFRSATNTSSSSSSSRVFSWPSSGCSRSRSALRTASSKGSRPHRLAITCNAAAASSGSQPAEDPYQVLGVLPLASFDAIKVAHRKKLKEAGNNKGDREAEIERIDRAYDAIMMRQLSMRKQGVTFGDLKVSSDIKYADSADVIPWRPRYEKCERKAILINAAVSAAMGAWMVAAGSTEWKILQVLLSFYVFQLFMKLDPFYPQNTEDGEKRWQRNGRRLTRALSLVFGCIALASLVHTLLLKAYPLVGMYVPRALYTFQESLITLFTSVSLFIMGSYYR